MKSTLPFILICAAVGLVALAAVACGGDGDSDELSRLDIEVKRLINRLDVAEGRLEEIDAAPPASIPDSINDDLNDLYARSDLSLCERDANITLDDAEEIEDAAYLDYLSDNLSFAAYERAYETYERVYDAYGQELDRCWDIYNDTTSLTD